MSGFCRICEEPLYNQTGSICGCCHKEQKDMEDIPCNNCGVKYSDYLELVKCVEYYANTGNWWWESHGDKDYMDTISDEDMEKIETTSRIQGYEIIGGKLARECLRRINERKTQIRESEKEISEDALEPVQS